MEAQSVAEDELDFDVVLRGYHRRQVERCVADLTARLNAALDRLEVIPVLQRQLREAQGELERIRLLGRHLPVGPQVGDRIARILAAAEEQAAALRAEAERDAQAIRDRAYAQAMQARREFEAALDKRRERQRRTDRILGSLDVDEPDRHLTT